MGENEGSEDASDGDEDEGGDGDEGEDGEEEDKEEESEASPEPQVTKAKGFKAWAMNQLSTAKPYIAPIAAEDSSQGVAITTTDKITEDKSHIPTKPKPSRTSKT